MRRSGVQVSDAAAAAEKEPGLLPPADVFHLGIVETNLDD
jgi:hypothetical protein